MNKDMYLRSGLIFHSNIKLGDKDLWLYYTEEPRYKDLVISDDLGNTLTLPTESLLYLISTFANHLSTQPSTQDVSHIQSRESQV